MELLTISQDFYPGYEPPLWVQTAAAFASDLGRGERFRLATALRHDSQAPSPYRDRCLVQALVS